MDIRKKNIFKFFLVNAFRSLYLLMFEPDLTDTLPDIRYCSKILCCTIPNPFTNLEFKVKDFEILH